MELVHSLAEHFKTLVKKLNNVNINYSKIPKKHRGPHAVRVFRTPDLNFQRKL